MHWPVKSLKEYQAQFDADKNTKALGEASPLYLFTPGVPKQIKNCIPDVKLILILRNPIERAYSTYLKNRREGLETRMFEDALHAEINNPGRIVQSQTYYIRAGLYFQHLTRYLEYFDRAQIYIDTYENLGASTQTLLANIFEFLGVDAGFEPDISVKFNQAIPALVKGEARRRKIKSVTRLVRSMLPQKIYFQLLNLQYGINARVKSYPPLTGETRLFLQDQYIEDIENLQRLLQRDFSHWLVVE